MTIANVEISRAITHEVVRTSKIAERTPVLSNELIVLEDKLKELVGRRLTNTIGSGSHSVDVTVDDSTAGSPFDRVTSMLDAKDLAFVENSKHLAGSLSSAQTAGAIKSGTAIFIQGTCFADHKTSRFIAIIKADSDQGASKRIKGDSIVLTYINDMVLGESQRLVKIAFLIEDAERETESPMPRSTEDFTIQVFDHLMQPSGENDAAFYFYKTFLKCSLSHNAARKTKQFVDVVRAFIDELPLPPSERVAFHGDLISYLRRQDRSTIQPRTFAQEVLPRDYRYLFLEKCKTEGITQAFSKNLDLVKAKMRRQSVKFTSNVTLHASPEVLRDAVRILGTSEDGWTEVKIRGTVEAMP